MPRSLRQFCLAGLVAMGGLLTPEVGAGQIDLRLDVNYTGAEASAGGTWRLFARSDEQGIFSLRAPLAEVDAGVVNELPVGRVNGSVTDNAGFSTFVNLGGLTQRDLFFAQQFVQVGQGDQGAFYGVGTVAGGTPTSIGPSLGTLTGVQNVPWATADPLWATGVTVASGVFSPGATPAFGSGALEGSLFTTVGTATTPGSTTVDVSFTTEVVTNLNAMIPADFNGDGTVDLLDLDILGTNFGSGPGATKSQGDVNADGFVDLLDLDALGLAFGSGGSTAVPEPSAIALLAAAGGLLARGRQQNLRFRGPIC